MTHSYTFFNSLEFIIEAVRKSSELHSKLTDCLILNAQLLCVVQKDDRALSKQFISDRNVASIVRCCQTDQLQQPVIIQQKKNVLSQKMNSLSLISKTVIYFELITHLKTAREYLVARL